MISSRSRHSRRAVPIHRSAKAFAGGAWGGVLRTRVPAAANTASKVRMNFVSRSRTRNFIGCPASSRTMTRLPACWVTQSPVGWPVTPNRWTRRLPMSMAKNT